MNELISFPLPIRIRIVAHERPLITSIPTMKWSIWAMKEASKVIDLQTTSAESIHEKRSTSRTQLKFLFEPIACLDKVRT